ncbi:helix-turn-helix transcriptional regulator [Vibrio harveyi]|uniref:helix-turn-helix transcriptional regulator n=1 Tax=Vibrio sp. MMH1-50 TaxID=2917764 RepID=UPI001EF2CCC8|nr:AraC family transcriptional regulator [Vibrio sp. MMH1-50]ELH4832408.1 helix-turn-helix transcriptional regulator [Vibrio harveyi]MCG7514640.1 AraC family transcriptional regulator [Vibrio sp. MMH1-50]
MSNIVKSLNLVGGVDGTFDVVALDDDVNAYIVNCTATTDIQFNDPADAGFYISFAGINHAFSPKYPDYPAASFASRCIASLLPKPEPVNPIELGEGGRIENIRIHFPLHHSLTKNLLPQNRGSSFKPFDLYETGWQMPLTGEILNVAKSIWNNDFQGIARTVWLRGKILELLALLMVHKEPKSLAEQACDLIATQPHIDWNIPGLSKELATNECYLKQSFREQFNMGVASWIQAYRISLAKERLANPNESITKIALDLGYQSGSYFSKVFKQHTGLTPKTFRSRSPKQ